MWAIRHRFEPITRRRGLEKPSLELLAIGAVVRQRRRPDALRTVIAMAFFWPTRPQAYCHA